jgi:sugar-specific transcriptional regulator TrmB
MANVLNVKQSVMDALKTIGLNLYERRLWVSLLSKGNSTAGELADLSNVPRSRCYDVLESLADKGFVIVQPAKPMRYVAIKPREAMDRAKKRLVQKTDEMVKRIIRIQDSEVMKDLEKIHAETIKIMKPEDMTGALRGRDALIEQLESVLGSAKKSVNMLTTEQGLMEVYENHAKLLQKAAKGGVQIKIAAPLTKKSEAIVKEMSKFSQIRDVSGVENIQNVLTRAYSVDGQHFILSLTNDETTKPNEDMNFWTQSDHAANEFFDPIFKMLWKCGKDV